MAPYPVPARDERVNTVPVKVVAVKVDALANRINEIRSKLAALPLDSFPDYAAGRVVVDAVLDLDGLLAEIVKYKAASSYV